MRDGRTDGEWVRDTLVNVAGTEKSDIVAVLQVEPPEIPFFIGWKGIIAPLCEFYSRPVEPHEGLFAMKVGKGEVAFVARAVDGTTPLRLKIVAITGYDDPEYADVPCY